MPLTKQEALALLDKIAQDQEPINISMTPGQVHLLILALMEVVRSRNADDEIKKAAIGIGQEFQGFVAKRYPQAQTLYAWDKVSQPPQQSEKPALRLLGKSDKQDATE